MALGLGRLEKDSNQVVRRMLIAVLVTEACSCIRWVFVESGAGSSFELLEGEEVEV